MTQATVYDTDILIWSEHQADLLRRVANGTAGNETPDWENIAEEIAAVGASERRALASHVRNIIELAGRTQSNMNVSMSGIC